MFVRLWAVAPLPIPCPYPYMTPRPGETDADQLRDQLTPKQARAAELYVAGPPDCVGSKVGAYVRAYNWAGSRRGAQVKASGLFAREDVAAYVRALRAAGTGAAVDTLRDWSELAVDAQETIHRAATGSLPAGLSDEQVRSALRAAQYIVDRAYGTPSQQIELRSTGGITVEVAGPATLGRVVEVASSAARGAAAMLSAGAEPGAELVQGEPAGELETADGHELEPGGADGGAD